MSTGKTPPTSDADSFGGEIPFFKPTDLDQGYRVTRSRYTLTPKGAAATTLLPPGAVLVTCIGATVGKTGLARVACTTNQQINALVTHRLVFPEWAFWWLASSNGQQLISDNASATTLPIINKSRFQSLPMPVPPLAEQSAAIARLESLLMCNDALVEQAIAARSIATLFEQSILSKAFRGELVPQDPNDEPASVLLERIRAERAALGGAPATKKKRGRSAG